ncbi:MAG: homoserine O-succinyltransferase [Bacteroidetes bacterium]|nr:homoserine O-succinyltransferase [Bacteroidota bacterium]MBS1975531.1 homoserine O-succinyltransferase [Bacteroidota bacterium]
MFREKKIRIAILDMNEKFPNQGMRCLRQILKEFSEKQNIEIEWDEFEVRIEKQIPDMSYDIYISSGGPGSPLDSEGSDWEKAYFRWLSQIEHWNSLPSRQNKKYVFLICHSFQLVCRHYKIADVIKRKSTSFGIFPIHIVQEGKSEPVFTGLSDPFYSVDSRDYQVVQPHHNRMQQMGAKVLCIEKERPHIPLERAVMAIRFNDYMIGMQFHPEADAEGMTMYLHRDDKKQTVIENHGEEKWKNMISYLNDPDKILLTYSHVIPNFLQLAVNQFQEMEA